jgi:hypothetical protein
MNQKSSKERILKIRPFVVCFLDVMGQKDKLKGWENPPTKSPSKEYRQSLDETLGRVKFVREAFQCYYEDDENYFYSRMNDTLSKINIDPKELSQPTLNFQKFSDSTLFFAQLMDDEKQCFCFYPVWLCFKACVQVIPVLLSDKIVIRGGLHIGMGAELGENDFYGPALGEAYKLESECAIYPRVAISKDLVDFLDDEIWNSPTTIQEELNVYFRNELKRMITKDSEGQYMLDYLGADFYASIVDVKDHSPEKKAYEFICKERDRFAKNEKLGPRYQKLVEYWESRRENWDK